MIEPREFLVDGLRLTGGVAEAPGGRAQVILCHGIPSGYEEDPVDQRYPGLAEAFADQGFKTWWFNFRGVRGSEGEFTLGGWINDLHGVVGDVSEPNAPLFVVGSSAGGAVALCVAAENTSISGIATLGTPAIWGRGRNSRNETLLEHSRRVGIVKPGSPRDEESWWAEFETNRPEWAAALMGGRPLLVINGTDDDVVSVEHARRIYDQAGEPKRLILLEGAGHQLRREPRAVRAIFSWLDEQLDASRRAALDSDR